MRKRDAQDAVAPLERQLEEVAQEDEEQDRDEREVEPPEQEGQQAVGELLGGQAGHAREQRVAAARQHQEARRTARRGSGSAGGSAANGAATIAHGDSGTASGPSRCRPSRGSPAACSGSGTPRARTASSGSWRSGTVISDGGGCVTQRIASSSEPTWPEARISPSSSATRVNTPVRASRCALTTSSWRGDPLVPEPVAVAVEAEAVGDADRCAGRRAPHSTRGELALHGHLHAAGGPGLGISSTFSSGSGTAASRIAASIMVWQSYHTSTRRPVRVGSCESRADAVEALGAAVPRLAPHRLRALGSLTLRLLTRLLAGESGFGLQLARVRANGERRHAVRLDELPRLGVREQLVAPPPRAARARPCARPRGRAAGTRAAPGRRPGRAPCGGRTRRGSAAARRGSLAVHHHAVVQRAAAGQAAASRAPGPRRKPKVRAGAIAVAKRCGVSSADEALLPDGRRVVAHPVVDRAARRRGAARSSAPGRRRESAFSPAPRGG